MTGANETLLTVSDELAGAVERVASAIVTVHAGDRRPASGVIWSEGVVVTAAHAVRREEGIELGLADGSRAAADLAGLDAGTDLAVVKCGAARSTALERADLDALKVGQLAVAVARLSEHGVNASLGIIGGLGNAWRTWRGGTVEQLIRVAISLYPGFSGGALLDARGRIVGINTAGLSRSSIALPNTTVERVTAELLAGVRGTALSRCGDAIGASAQVAAEQAGARRRRRRYRHGHGARRPRRACRRPGRRYLPACRR